MSQLVYLSAIGATMAMASMLIAAEVSAQGGQCSMKLADLPEVPELVGFHLGMTKEQVRARVPQVQFGRTDKFGVSKTTINPDFDPRFDKATFSGVRSVSLDFLDDRLTSLWIGYDSTFKATTVEELVETITKSLHLPASWTNWRLRGRQMSCADFHMIVQMIGEGSSFRIVDLKADDTIAARRQAEEEERERGAAAPHQEPHVVLGNRRAKVYYPAGCETAKTIAESDRVVFTSAEEAEKAGFKAKNCP